MVTFLKGLHIPMLNFPPLVSMSEAQFQHFLQGAIRDYANQNIASGRWTEDQAMALSVAEHQRLLPDGVTSKDQHLFVIQDSESELVVGHLWLAVQENLSLRQGYVYAVEIDDVFRRQGHARRAFLALESVGKALGLTSIGLHVFAFNLAAQALYESLGYRVTGFNLRKSLSAEA
jgi:ribosomal protein S18 acetylase RimI-like enzyme